MSTDSLALMNQFDVESGMCWRSIIQTLVEMSIDIARVNSSRESSNWIRVDSLIRKENTRSS